MKNICSVFLMFLFTLSVRAQKMDNCCQPTATELYALNASDKQFQMSHEDPIPFTYISEKGKDINYKTEDGNDAHAFEIKTNSSPYYLFVIHEWYGLNDYIKQEAEKLSNELGINVLALDLYDNKVAAGRDSAARYVQSVKTDRAMHIIHGAFAYVGTNAKVFTIGWCFGGGWSLQAAIEGGKQTVGCIMYYGQPEKDIARLKKLNSDIIGFFGNKDQFPGPAIVDQFVTDAEKAGVKLIVNRYDAGHGFANPSNPSHNKEATDDAHVKVLAYVKERMK